MPPINIIWFRRDLRLYDHAALHHALKDGRPVLPVFIFDRNILDQLEDKDDARVEFIHLTLSQMQEQLTEWGSGLEIFYDSPEKVFADLISGYDIASVFTNNDYEPYARHRDAYIARQLQNAGVSFFSFKDQVIFEKDEVVKDDGSAYTVFTPYSKRWKASLQTHHLNAHPVEPYRQYFLQRETPGLPSLERIGFKKTGRIFPASVVSDDVLKHYTETRDYPSLTGGTSHLSVHLRFGTISIRELVKRAMKLNDAYLNELIWREFYQMILWHFPRVGKGESFRPEYDFIPWRNNETEFERWCEGNTGYPIVDAGMRELNATGYMHNRVRMITASFLTKHLLIDWRWGEAYFARRLLDFDLAANNGGWQWASGSGCDAAPYFRVFNPYLQTEKFDKDLVYVTKWVPEFQQPHYPEPIIDHDVARKRALDTYNKTLKDSTLR